MTHLLVSTHYDTGNPEAHHNIVSLLLLLDSRIEIELPNGEYTVGILREVNPVGSRIVELIVQIPAMYESLYYVNHDRHDMNLVRRA